MPNITVARTGEILRGLFRVLEQNPDGLRAGQAIKTVSLKVPPTAWEETHTKAGGRRYDKIIRWSTVDCVKSGWIIKDDGKWFITDEGLAALKRYPDPADFYGKALELYKAWKAAQNDTAPIAPIDKDMEDDDEPNLKDAVITLEKAQEQASEQIAAYLHAMDPHEFQKLVGALLTGMGYHVAWISPPGKDDGIDLVAYPDPLGTRSPRIKVQVKRYQAAVPVGDVSQFMGNLGSEEVGIFVSTGNFTKDAESKARTDKQHRVTLVGLDALVKLWVQHYDKLDQAAKRRLPLRPVHFLAPEG